MNQRPPLRCTEADAHFLDLNYRLDFRFLFAILLDGRGNGKQALSAPLPSRLSRAGSCLLINPFDTSGFRSRRNLSRLVERPALPPHYAPLQQLFTDLANNTVADYNWITPDQFNDMHTTLSAGYKGLTGDPAKICKATTSFGRLFLRSWHPRLGPLAAGSSTAFTLCRAACHSASP